MYMNLNNYFLNFVKLDYILMMIHWKIRFKHMIYK